MPVSEHVSNEWAKKTAQRVYEEIDQAEVVEMSSEIFSYFLCRWEKGPQCPEPRLTVGPKEYETLHHYLVGLNLVYGHMIVKVECRATEGTVWIGCYSAPEHEREAIIQIRAEPAQPRSARVNGAIERKGLFGFLENGSEPNKLDNYEEIDRDESEELDEEWVKLDSLSPVTSETALSKGATGFGFGFGFGFIPIMSRHG